MPDWTLISSICAGRTCQLVYRSGDGLVGMFRTSGGRRADRIRYFLWDLPDSAPEYASEAEARAALDTQETTPSTTQA